MQVKITRSEMRWIFGAGGLGAGASPPGGTTLCADECGMSYWPSPLLLAGDDAQYDRAKKLVVAYKHHGARLLMGTEKYHTAMG